MNTCNPCGYSTKKKSNFRNHLTSKNHITICKDALVCSNCLRTFSKQGPRYPHVKACKIVLCPKSFNRRSANDGTQDRLTDGILGNPMTATEIVRMTADRIISEFETFENP